MRSFCATVLIILLSAFVGNAQPSVDELTNEAIIKLVADGVPSATIIRTIQAAERVSFRFLPGDLIVFEQAKVPDDVFKAMAAKQNGSAIPGVSRNPTPIQSAPTSISSPAVQATPPPPQAPSASAPSASAPAPTPVVPTTPAADAPSAPIPSSPKHTASSSRTKTIKIHGYVTAIKSPSEFEIDEYRITRDSSLALELEKSEDAQEKTTFNADEIRVGTEMEIRGELDESSVSFR